jgi:hypothetical protein
MEYVKALPSGSLPVSVIATGVLAAVVAEPLFAVGAWFGGGVTVMEMVARPLFVVPSFTRKVKLSAPLKPAFGV